MNELPPSTKLCNCAECGVDILGESMRPWYMILTNAERASIPKMVYCRVNGRPYCPECGNPGAGAGVKTPPGKRARRGGGGTDPSQDNAIRALEDG